MLKPRGSDTEETNLPIGTVTIDESADTAVTMLFAAVRRDCADEFADAAVTMLFELLSCWGAAAGERDCADESADAAVTMLFELLGWSCWGAMRRRICGQSCCHAICSCWVQVLGSDTAETNLRRDAI